MISFHMSADIPRSLELGGLLSVSFSGCAAFSFSDTRLSWKHEPFCVVYLTASFKSRIRSAN